MSGTTLRSSLVNRALGLEYFTLGWNLVEGVVGVAAALAASSTVLLGFGIESFVESASGGILVWRFQAERRAPTENFERLERRALRLVGLSLLLLAGFIVCDASFALWRREHPLPTLVGILLPTLSMAVMYWLGRAKRRAAAGLQSRALEADAFQTTACFWLSVLTLTGIGLNAALGWWWADPVAALGMSLLLVREGQSAWRGEMCGDCCESQVGDTLRPGSTRSRDERGP